MQECIGVTLAANVWEYIGVRLYIKLYNLTLGDVMSKMPIGRPKSTPTKENFTSQYVSVLETKAIAKIIGGCLECLPEPIIDSVGTELVKFCESFVKETVRVKVRDLPRYIEASKERLKLFRSMTVMIISTIKDRQDVLLINKNGTFISKGFIPVADRILVALEEADGELYVTKLIAQCYPRSFRFLYESLVRIVLHFQENRYGLDDKIYYLTNFLVLAQSIGQIYETVQFTEEETELEQREWLATITDCSPKLDPVLDQAIEDLFAEIHSARPRRYVSDIKSGIRLFNSFIQKNRWTVEDYASRSHKASATRDKIIKVPNMHLLMSMQETDIWTFPGDSLIGYYNNYPSIDVNTPRMVKTRTRFISKTTRGIRAVMIPSGPIRDRAEYFLHAAQLMLNRRRGGLRNDSTFSQDEDALFVMATTLSGEYWSISLDLKSATDRVYQTLLEKIWTLAFGKDICDYLMELSTGENLVTVKKFDGVHDLYHVVAEREGEVDILVNQTRGIKQGIPFVFELGLSFVHHIITRCVMLRVGLQDQPPEDVVRILGDDSFSRTRVKGDIFRDTYVQLMTLGGFQVHDLQKKGLFTPPKSLENLGEYTKKVYNNGMIISAIPFKLFFRESNLENDLARIDWLSQYKTMVPFIPEMVSSLLYRNNDCTVLADAIRIFSKYGVLGLSPAILAGEVDEERELTILSAFCISALRSSVAAKLLNPKGRLTPLQVEEKRCFFESIRLGPKIQSLLDFAHNNGVEMTTLEFVMLKNSYILERAADLLELKQLESYLILTPFSESEVDIVDKILSVINDLEAARLLFSHEYIVEILISGKKLLTSIRQHDIVGHKGNVCAVISDTVEAVRLVEHYASTTANA